MVDWKRLKEPSFVVGAACFALLLVLLFSRDGTSPSSSQLVGFQQQVTDQHTELAKRLQKIEALLSDSQKTDNSSPAIALHTSIDKTNTRLADLEKTLQKVETLLSDSSEGDSTDPELELHTTADAVKLVSALGGMQTAEKLAECLGTVDGWIAGADEQDALQTFKVQQVDKLRALVKKELADLHDNALKAETGSKAGDFHAKASQILALYPISNAQTVLDEARQISSRHAEIGVRIDVIRRQRYNAWAMTQIEETINTVNATANSFKTSDNPKTIEATVKSLGEVDPNLLEPVVAQLYNYAVEQAKGNVSSAQQLELGKRMIDPKIRRKGYGDF